MNNGSLGGIVHSLELGDIDNATTHRRSSNEAAGDVILQRFAVQSRALLLLAAEVTSCALCTPHDAVDIDFHDLACVFSRAIEKWPILPWDTRIGDKYVEPAIKLAHNLGDGVVDRVGRCDVDLVCFACAQNCENMYHKFCKRCNLTYILRRT